MQILPWHESRLQYLLDIHKDGRLPHALLLAGPAGTGKSVFAQTLAWSLIQKMVSDDDGGRRLLARLEAGTYPDFIEITPLDNKSTISVDQIRYMCERLSLTSHTDVLKIALIEPAETMTNSAANALLKTLEEPPGDALIILVSDRRGRLPQTIRSRCHAIPFNLPDRDTALNWLSEKIGHDAQRYLDLAGYAPLRALQFHQQGMAEHYDQLTGGLSGIAQGKMDIVTMAQKWLEFDRTILFAWMMNITRRLINQKMDLKDTFNDYGKSMKHLKISVDRIDLKKLFQFQDELLRSQQDSDANLNRELFIEKLMIAWSDLVLT